MDVEVVVRVLADAAERLELGQDAGGGAEPVEQLEPTERVRPADQQPQLGQLALAGRLTGARGRFLRQPRRRGVEPDPELRREPGRAQDPQRVVGETALGDRPQHTSLEVVGAAERVGRLGGGVGERHRDRVHGEVALGEVVGDRGAADPGDVDVPAAVRGERTPGTELARELERGTAGGPADRPRGRLRVAVDRKVEVDHPATGDRVADRPADDPGAGFGAERRSGDLDRRGAGERLGGRAHRAPASSRGTLGEIPQVIS